MVEAKLKSIEIISKCKNGELAFTTGAGISYPAGVPLVGQIADVLLSELELYDDILKQNKDIYESRHLLRNEMLNLQFESVVSTLVANIESANTVFFDVFNADKNNYQPAIAHLVIAYLAHLGKISTVATFNIDQLHEVAFDKVFTLFGSDKTLKIYNSTEKNSVNSFGKTDWLNPHHIRLLKWHGDVRNKKSLGMTMEQIASQSPQSSRMGSMRRFYGGTPISNIPSQTAIGNSVLHSHIGVLGSEVGNNFDENIVLGSLNKSYQRIFMVYHQPNDKEPEVSKFLKDVHSIRGNENKFNPFLTFDPRSIWEYVDTKKVLSPFLPIEVQECEIRPVKPALDQVIDWLRNTPSTLRHLAAADLLKKMGYAKEALKHAVSAEQDCPINVEGAEKALAISYEAQGSLLESSGNLDNALGKYQSALNIYLKMKDEVGQAKIWNEQANIYQTLGQFEKATKGFFKAIKVFKKKPFDETYSMGLAVATANLAFVYRQQGNIKEAKRHYKRAEISLKKLGKIGDVAIMYNKHGRLAMLHGDVNVSEKFFIQARVLGEKCGRYTAVAESYDGRALIAQHQGYPAEAKVLFSKAILAYQKANDSIGIVSIQTNMANLLRSQGKYREALDIYIEVEKKAVGVAEKLTAINNQATVFQAWYQSTHDRKYLDKALPLFNYVIEKEQTNSRYTNQENLAVNLLNRSLIFMEMGNNSVARIDLQKAKSIAEKNEFDGILSNVFISFGTLEQNSEDYNTALNYYEKARSYQMSEESGSILENNIGYCFEKLGHFQKALSQYEVAIVIGEKGQLSGLLMEYYASAALISKELGNQNQALNYAHKAYDAAKKAELPNTGAWIQLIENIKMVK